MYEPLPISGIRETYRIGSGPRTVVLPLLMAAIVGGLGYFVLKAWDGPGAPIAGSELVSSAANEPAIASSPASEAEVSPDPTETVPATIPAASPLPLLSPADVAEGDYTAWMSPLALDTYIRQRNRGQKGSFWSRGNWIRAVEGRWRNGAREYRIALGTMARPGEIRWRYRLDLTEISFAEELARHGGEGFVLRQSQSFRAADGSARYQAVWVRPE